MEHVNYPGQATSLLGLASYSKTQGCFPDTGTNAAVNNTGFNTPLIQLPNPKGSFQFSIPMRHIFGFVDDYSKVTYGMRDTLQLIRKEANDALFCTAAAGVGISFQTCCSWASSISIALCKIYQFTINYIRCKLPIANFHRGYIVQCIYLPIINTNGCNKCTIYILV